MGDTPLQCEYVAWSDFDWHQRSLEVAMRRHQPIVEINMSVFFFIYATQVLALYMSCELIVETFLRFQKWTSLYFCSLIVTACGILVFTIINTVINVLEALGSDAMNAMTFVAKTFVTTGFALVLYSRLHTIAAVKYSKYLRLLLLGIVVVTVSLRIPEIVLMAMIDNAYVATDGIVALSTRIWYFDYGYTLLEILLASVYIWWFYSYLDDLPEHSKAAFENEKKKTMIWLVACFAANIGLGIVQMIIVHQKLRLLGDTWWTLQYAIKVKFEFVVLNRLTKVTEAKRAALAEGNWINIVREDDSFSARLSRDVRPSGQIAEIRSDSNKHDMTAAGWMEKSPSTAAVHAAGDQLE